MERICDFCGTREQDPGRLLTWTTAMEHGRGKNFCMDCSRQHLRMMEGKLDSDLW